MFPAQVRRARRPFAVVNHRAPSSMTGEGTILRSQRASLRHSELLRGIRYRRKSCLAYSGASDDTDRLFLMTKRTTRKIASSKTISKMAELKNVIFWGAGATAALGIRTTARQEQFIRFLTGVDDPGASLTKRVAKALGSTAPKPWHRALIDLITILGDSDVSYNSITDLTDRQLKAMSRNWQKRTS